MGSVNKVILVGNLGRDAELRYTPGGAPVATLNLATTEVWNDKASGQKQEKTEWHRIVLWGKSAESLSEYLTKGKQIYVEGRLQTRKWQDKDGNDKYTTEIRGDRIDAARRRRRWWRRHGCRRRAAPAQRAARGAGGRRRRSRADGRADQRPDRRRYPVLEVGQQTTGGTGPSRRPLVLSLPVFGSVSVARCSPGRPGSSSGTSGRLFHTPSSPGRPASTVRRSGRA